jgi:hypothetical protein
MPLVKKADRGSAILRFTPRLLVCLFILLSLHSTLFVILQFHSRGWGEVARFGPPPPPRQSSELQTNELPISEQTRVSKNRKKASQKRNMRKGKVTITREQWLRVLAQKGETVLPKPRGWEKLGFDDIREHFACEEYSHNIEKPLPTLEDWEYLRNRYIEIVDKDAVFEDAVPPTEGYTYDENGPPPYYASHGERGRGLFASRDIKQGEFIHDGTKSDIEFPGGEAWRLYILSLPRYRACDVIDWSWTQKTSRDGEYKIFSAMNISILLNGADYMHELNVKPLSNISSRFYALRDIKKGEELLTDYDAYDTVWEEVGLESK